MRILISGASRGIGRAIAVAAAGAGHELALVSRSADELERLALEIVSRKGRAVPFVCDVSSSQAVERLHRDVIERLGGIDAIVNNAGIAPSLKLEDTTDDIWRRTFATNVDSAFFLCRGFAADLKQSSSGHIVNIVSTAAFEGFAYTAAYTASKHALLGLSRALAKEFAKHSIAVATVAPGFVRTAILDESIRNIIGKTGKSAVEAEQALASMNRSGRIIEPEEVAAAVMNALTLPADPNGREIFI